MRRHTKYLTLVLILVATSCGNEGVEDAPSIEAVPVSQEVVFVCEHGSVKSLMSSTMFNQMAEARGLNIRSISRGLEPDEAVPQEIAEAFMTDSVDVTNYKPRLLSSTEVASATRVISIGVDLSSYGDDAPFEEWNGVPPASVDFDLAQEDMRRRIEVLLGELSNEIGLK